MSATPSVGELHKETLQLDESLRSLLQKDPFSSKINPLRLCVRQKYESILFSDYEFAVNNDVEQNLWKSVFYKPIEAYRRRIREYANARSKGNIEAQATMSKYCDLFREFLSDATNFYQNLIQTLHDTFDLPLVKNTIEGTEYITQTIDKESHSSIQSCYRSYIFLGDLTRYHRDLFDEKERKTWTNAYIFYQKAMYLMPQNGNPHNQMAVLATYREDEFESVYRYYRSLAVRNPFLTAKENLIILFDKNRKRFDDLPEIIRQFANQTGKRKGKNISGQYNTGGKRGTTQQNQELLKWFLRGFVRLHGVLFTKAPLQEFFQLKDGVISLLDTLLKRDFIAEELLLKIITMNIFIYECTQGRLDPPSGSSANSEVSIEESYEPSVTTFIIEFIIPAIQRAVRCNNNNKYLSALTTFMEWLLSNEKISPPSPSPDEKQPSPILPCGDARTWRQYWKLSCQLLTAIHSSRYLTDEFLKEIGNREGLPLLPEEIELRGFRYLEKVYKDLPLFSSQTKLPSGIPRPDIYRAVRIAKLINLAKDVARRQSPTILYFSTTTQRFTIQTPSAYFTPPSTSIPIGQNHTRISATSRFPIPAPNLSQNSPILQNHSEFKPPPFQQNLPDHESNSIPNVIGASNVDSTSPISPIGSMMQPQSNTNPHTPLDSSHSLFFDYFQTEPNAAPPVRRKHAPWLENSSPRSPPNEPSGHQSFFANISSGESPNDTTGLGNSNFSVSELFSSWNPLTFAEREPFPDSSWSSLMQPCDDPFIPSDSTHKITEDSSFSIHTDPQWSANVFPNFNSPYTSWAGHDYKDTNGS